MVRVINIWDEVFCKLLLSLDGLVTSKKVLSDSSHRIQTHLDVVVEVLDIYISVSFELCLDKLAHRTLVS